MLILGEEDKLEIGRRLNAIARHDKLDDDQIGELQEKVLAFGMVGLDTRLTAPTKKSPLAETKFALDIITAANKMDALRLIVLDHLALFHGGDFNAREDAALTMRVVNHIAQETDAAVLLLAHTPKGAVASEQSDASMIAGSTAFVDQARSAWILATMRENEAKSFKFPKDERSQYASLVVVKNNYGPTGDTFWLERIAFDDVGLIKYLPTGVPQPT
jgi:RecA-family ATPase